MLCHVQPDQLDRQAGRQAQLGSTTSNVGCSRVNAGCSIRFHQVKQVVLKGEHLSAGWMSFRTQLAGVKLHHDPGSFKLNDKLYVGVSVNQHVPIVMAAFLAALNNGQALA